MGSSEPKAGVGQVYPEIWVSVHVRVTGDVSDDQNRTTKQDPS